MAQILIRGLDETVVNRLKRRAKSRGRSLQAEVKGILEQAAKIDMADARKFLLEFQKTFRGRRFSDSTPLIRKDRER